MVVPEAAGCGLQNALLTQLRVAFVTCCATRCSGLSRRSERGQMRQKHLSTATQLALLALLLAPRAFAPPHLRQEQDTDAKSSPGAMPRAEPGQIQAARERKAATDATPPLQGKEKLHEPGPERTASSASVAVSSPTLSPRRREVRPEPGYGSPESPPPPPASRATAPMAAAPKQGTAAASGGTKSTNAAPSSGAKKPKAVKKPKATKLGPQQSAAFPTLYVPDLRAPLVESLAALVTERAARQNPEPRLMLVEFYAPWCPHCQRFAPELERLGAAVNGRADADPPTVPVSALVARVDCVAERALCESYGVKGYPTLLVGTSVEDFELKDGSPGTQSLSDMLHIPSADSRKIDIIVRAMSSYLGNLSISVTNGALASATSGNDLATSSRIALPTQDDFNAELTRRLHAQAVLESTLASSGTTDGLDSWLASRRNAADIEMALVMSAQTVVSRLWSAADTNRSTEEDKALLQQDAVRAGRLFSLVGPAYSEHPWAAQFDHYVQQPQRLSKLTSKGKAAPHPNGWLDRWGAFGRPLKDYKRDWESCIGMFSFQRGYPCALWQLLHTTTVGMSDDNAAIEMGNLIGFISRFFECKDCRDHFIEMASTIQVKIDSDADTHTGETQSLTSLKSRKAAVLWLWRAHNAVTARIVQQETDEGANPFKSDQLHMKRIFPSEAACPVCRRPLADGESPESFGAGEGEGM
eukprot:COSAG02_NODE_7996_length_2755_cov_2.200678_1_plen_699_part_01